MTLSGWLAVASLLGATQAELCSDPSGSFVVLETGLRAPINQGVSMIHVHGCTYSSFAQLGSRLCGCPTAIASCTTGSCGLEFLPAGCPVPTTCPEGDDGLTVIGVTPVSGGVDVTLEIRCLTCRPQSWTLRLVVDDSASQPLEFIYQWTGTQVCPQNNQNLPDQTKTVRLYPPSYPYRYDVQLSLGIADCGFGDGMEVFREGETENYYLDVVNTTTATLTTRFN